MERETGCQHAHACLLAGGLGDAQHAQFVLGTEAVARLDLGGGGAEAPHRLESLGGAGDQLVFGRLARQTHARLDAAALGGDALVVGALGPQIELVNAVAAVDNVCVAVDEAGDSALPCGVDNFGISGECHGGVDLVAGTNGFDVARANRDCRVVNDAELSVSIDGGEAGEIVDQKVGGLHGVSLRVE